MRPLLILLALLPSLCLSKDIIYQKYKFKVPDEYKMMQSEISDTLYFFIEGQKPNLALGELKKDSYKPSEFGVSSKRQIFRILYNDEVPSTNKSILELRRLTEKFKLQKKSISEDRGFVFFRMDNALDRIGVTFLVSTPINDEMLKINFFGEPDEKFIKSVMDSLKVK